MAFPLYCYRNFRQRPSAIAKLEGSHAHRSNCSVRYVLEGYSRPSNAAQLRAQKDIRSTYLNHPCEDHVHTPMPECYIERHQMQGESQSMQINVEYTKKFPSVPPMRSTFRKICTTSRMHRVSKQRKPSQPWAFRTFATRTQLPFSAIATLADR